MPAKVRQAVYGDIDSIIDQGILCASLSPRYHKSGVGVEKMRSELPNLIDGGGIFVAEAEGEIVGFMAGALVQEFFGNDLTAVEICLFVHPDHRGGTIARDLVKSFESWAWESGAERVQVGVSSEIRSELVVGLYRRMGFRETGAILLKEK